MRRRVPMFTLGIAAMAVLVVWSPMSRTTAMVFVLLSGVLLGLVIARALWKLSA